MKAKELFSVWKKVFSNWKYLALTVIIALAFYSLNVFISDYKSIISFYSQVGFFGSIKLFFAFLVGFRSTTFLNVFITLIILSIFLGILFSLIAYKTKMIKSLSKKTGVFTTTGIFLGIIAPGCAACGVGLLSLFGISAATLAFLPFNGLELSALASIILLVLIFKITKDINKEIICKIDERG
ncbi:MAG: hypothetical protein IIA85_03450 [Nanoarchaeota archaeon]|nr:hypothetical protein [Nanoarchaeota archaeon]